MTNPNRPPNHTNPGSPPHRDTLEDLRRIAPRLPVDPAGLAAVRTELDAHLREADGPGPLRTILPRRTRYGILAGAAAVLAGVVLISQVIGGPGVAPAYAWSAAGARIEEEAAAVAIRECAEEAVGHSMFERDPEGDHYAPVPTNEDLSNPRLLVAEQRGETSLVFLEVGEWTLYCSSGEAGGVSAAIPADAKEIAPQHHPVEPLVITGRNGERGWFATVVGSMQEDVAAVTVILPDGQAIETTAANGTFVAWWPVPGAGTGTDPQEPAQPHLAEGVQVAWTYTDGTASAPVPLDDLRPPASDQPIG